MSFRDFPFLEKMIGGKIFKNLAKQRFVLFKIPFFSLKLSFKVDTEGLYCVRKGNISFSSLLLCFSQTFGCRLPLCEVYSLLEGFLSKFVGGLCQASVSLNLK